uniref:Uncharacterized protein n=1 Tax=Leersia perrieri TaxID=77586 RepID=A0A0D9V269_9ORYZ
MKKASSSNTVTSIVVATPASGMVFPHNEAVASATQKPKRVKKAAKKKGPPPTTSTNNSVTSRSVTGCNDPFALQIEHPPVVHEDVASYEVSPQTVQTPRKKQAVMKKCTPRRAPVEVANPSSPASNTRSKKKLELQ